MFQFFLPYSSFDVVALLLFLVFSCRQMMWSNTGPVLAMNRSVLSRVVEGYSVHTTGQQPHETFNQFNNRIRQDFRAILDTYLNKGKRRIVPTY